ncbi:MAG: helix-turn-helix domain-containing protein [Phycisphaerae bacterium]|nr:helix-turn-helix domain-containing protein [Phycisphaerae bacterium]
MPTNAPDRPIDAPDRIPTGRLCYSVAEAADQIRVSPRQVYTLARDAGLPTVKIGGRRLVRRADLERWIAAQPVDRPGADGPEALHPKDDCHAET